MLPFLMRPTTENNEITHEKKFWTHKIPAIFLVGILWVQKQQPTKHQREKNLRATKYPLENTHEVKMALWH